MIKKVLKILMDRLGYRIVPKTYDYPIDLRGIVSEPIYARYYARNYKFLIDADPSDCMILWRYSCSDNVGNPFVDTVADYCNFGRIEYENSKLKDYYESFQPENVAELFNLKGKLNRMLVEMPAYSMVYPWENADMNKKKKYRDKHEKIENKTRGGDLPIEDGIQCFGPVSEKKGELELNSLMRLVDSIKQKGYIRSGKAFEDISSKVLVKDQNCKHLIHEGMHRAAVLAGLGFEKLPVRVEPTVMPSFIYRDEFEFWPNVKNRLYTKEQALQVFDTIYHGRGE